ncbi:geranylgeranylglycerol-phosphate geranylgeranyltransferase [Adhaeribacter radiodurans]|uniref:Geranylgeranylglycerol-phosphate geranylgeranyltransferase n=2 Tax=Adhaeribacter radiodurans TaxID=2745197 RepID=A0A7L7LF16_9BACT|nr:geranylgeranylglycerol-phosphate geranylgeranyltransferase [Adhaeribacter radiodurans]
MAFCQLLVRACLLLPHQPWSQVLFDTRFLLLLFSTFCVAAAGYIINDYYDIKIDAINKPKRVVVGKFVNRRQAMLAHLVLSAIGVFVSFSLGIKVGLIHVGAALLLWGYSARLKQTFLIGNITIALLSATMVLVVPVFDNLANKAVWAYAAFVFLISIVREIIKDMEDVKGDASFDCRTLPIVVGIPGAKWFLYFFITAFAITLLTGVIYRIYEVLFTAYILLLVIVPMGFLTYKIYRADRKKDFTRLSRQVKWIMLAGMLSMLLFRYA